MRTVLSAYWPSIRKHWHLLAAVLACLFLSVAFNAVRPFLYEGLVDSFGAEKFDEEKAYVLVGLLAIALVGNWLFWRAVDWALGLSESRIMCDLEQRAFAELQRQPMSFHASSQSGALLKQAIKFRDSFEVILDILCYQLVRDFLMVAIAFCTFYWKRPDFAWMFAGWVVCFGVLNLIVLRIKKPMNKAATETSSKVSAVMGDSLGSHLMVKSYGHEAHEQRRLDRSAADSERRRWKSWSATIIAIAVQGLLMFGFELLLVHQLIQGRKEGTVTAGDFVFFQAAIANIFFLIWMFGHNVRCLQEKMADAKEMADIFHRVPEVQDAPDAAELHDVRGRIEFVDVTHSHNDNCKLHLDGVTLTVEPGETIGIVGETGAGKTTAVNALLRFFDIRSGSIRIDGVDIRSVTQRSLRSHFSVVSQMSEMFNDTIEFNLRFARPDATEAQIEDACRKAEIWDFIQGLKDGLRTEVGERGVKLSGGERQRLSIARAILADRPILILDEATSSLDNATERKLQAAMDQSVQGRTSFIIAHRLKTVERADRIVVMERGKIVEIGTHAQLLAKKGHYARLHAGGDHFIG